MLQGLDAGVGDGKVWHQNQVNRVCAFFFFFFLHYVTNNKINSLYLLYFWNTYVCFIVLDYCFKLAVDQSPLI